MRLNRSMQIRRLTNTRHLNRSLARTLAGIASAPLAVALGALSIAITIVVAISTVTWGRASTGAPLELICALVLAAAAAAEASRPARSERTRRRLDRSSGHGRGD